MPVSVAALQVKPLFDDCRNLLRRKIRVVYSYVLFKENLPEFLSKRYWVFIIAHRSVLCKFRFFGTWKYNRPEGLAFWRNFRYTVEKSNGGRLWADLL